MPLSEQELNRKLAEWAGLVYDEGAEYIGGGGNNNNNLMYGLWFPPDNSQDGTPCPPPFTQSLGACFKWLAPKVLRNGYTIEAYTTTEDTAVNIARAGETKAWDCKPEYALALCLAIEKLIDREQNALQ